MKKYSMLATFLVLAVISISPLSVSAKTKAGTKSGSFFYFFDKAFEKTSLFFTFNPEKKAKKALEHAEERLAEAEELTSENNPEAVKDAMENYKKNIEVLEKVLEKVPEKAKEAIEKAIEASKERQEEEIEETAELEKEVPEIKPELEETENELKEEENEEEVEIKDVDKKDDKKDEQSKEIEKLKKEVEGLKQKTSQIKIIEKIIEKPVIIEKTQSSSSQTKQKEITLPNGAVVEMDEKGNVVRTIKETLINTTNNTINSIQSTASLAGQSSSSFIGNSKLKVVVYEKDIISQSISGGISHFTLATFSILNPLSNRDVKLSEIVFSLSEFAKNISALNIEIQLPIDDFGDSNKFIVDTNKLNQDNFCERISLIGGNHYVDCKKFDLSKFQNISFDFPETSIIPAGKSVKMRILGNILTVEDDKLGEYKNFVKLNSCKGIIIKDDIPIVCNIENELVIQSGIILKGLKNIGGWGR